MQSTLTGSRGNSQPGQEYLKAMRWFLAMPGGVGVGSNCASRRSL